MQAQSAALHSSKRPAQLDLGLNSGADIDLEDQAKGRRGWVVRRNPVTGERQFVLWTFGTSDRAKILVDSRHLTRWARILGSPEALEYLRRTPEPDFERAWERSGGEAETVADHPMFAGAFRQHRAIVPAKV